MLRMTILLSARGWVLTLLLVAHATVRKSPIFRTSHAGRKEV